jgi:hypothetical protein
MHSEMKVVRLHLEQSLQFWQQHPINVHKDFWVAIALTGLELMALTYHRENSI